jgi:hypothetical protein
MKTNKSFKRNIFRSQKRTKKQRKETKKKKKKTKPYFKKTTKEDVIPKTIKKTK